jgi:hypothetical protein
MRRVKVHFENIPGSPYSQSRKHETPKLDREGADDYDIRTWLEKCNVNEEGHVIVPLGALKIGIDEAAHKLGKKVEGRRGATFRQFFTSGVICSDNAVIFNGSNEPLTKSDARMTVISCNPEGKRNGSKRVPRRFPCFDKYHSVALYTIVDDIVTKDVFEEHFRAMGIIVGIGRWRPGNGGNNGRFRPVRFEWEDYQL